MNGKRIAGLIALLLVAIVGLLIWMLASGDGEDSANDRDSASDASTLDPEAQERIDQRRNKKWKREGDGSVTGILREFGTERVLSKQLVTLSAGRPGPDAKLETRTDKDGAFRFPTVVNFDNWVLGAPLSKPLRTLEQSGVVVEADEATDLGIVYVMPDFYVPGIVVNDVGDPIPGARVKAVRSQPQEERANILRLIREIHHESVAVDIATSGKDGTFRLEKLVPGTYDLEVAKKGHRLHIRRDVLITPDRQDRPIRIVLQAGFQLGGRVIRTDGGPLAGLPVVAFEQPRSNLQNLTLDRRFATTDDNGAFLLDGLGAGEFMVLVHPQGRPIAMANNVSIPNTKRVDITIGGNAWLEGRITDGEGKPVMRANVFVVGLDQRRPRVADATTDTAGRYRIDGLESGDNGLFMVQAEGFGAHPPDFLQRVLRGSGGLVLKPGENRHDVSLGDGGILRGKVIMRDEETPVAGVTIALKSPRTFFGGTPSAVSAEDGSFEITGIPVGTTVLFAEKEGLLLPGLSPATLMSALINSMGGGGAQDSGRGNTLVFSEPGQVVERTVKLVRGAYVTGVVVDPEGAPVPGAQVSLQFASDNGWMDRILPLFSLGVPKVTGSDGSFRMAAPPPAQAATLVAKADGFLDGVSEQLKLRPGENKDGVRVTLRQGAALTGTVRDAKGQPLSGAQVRYMKMGSNNIVSGWALRNAEPTNTLEDGTFRISNVVTGKLIVKVSHPAYLSSSKENVQAAEGKTLKLDWKLSGGETLEGRVLDSSGQPLVGADVDFRLLTPRPEGVDKHFTDPPDPVTDADGRFLIEGLIPGRYELQANASNAAPSEPVEARTGESVTLRLAPSFVIAGMLRMAGGGPLGGMQVEASVKRGDNFSRVERVRSATDGTFRIEGLPAGTYRLNVNQGWRSGDDAPNVIPKFVDDVSSGSEGVMIDLSPGEVISGVVIGPDGEPIPRGWAAARELSPAEGRKRVSIGDLILDGKFTLKGLPPGDYRVTFHIDGGGNRDAVIVAGTQNARVDLSAGGVVRGTLLDEGGQAAPPGTEVRARTVAGRQFDARTEEDGSFEIRGVEPGTYTVSAGRNINNVMHFAQQADVVVSDGVVEVYLSLAPAE